MKITVEKSAIAAAMKQAVKVANPKSGIQILSHVAVKAEPESVTITANDSQRTYSATIPAVCDPGDCTIEADKLARAVNGMKSGSIEITRDQVKQGRSRLKLESRNYDEFPQPNYDDTIESGVTAEELSDAISVIQHAMATKDVRPMLNGIHLCEGFAVATDGHRMAVQEIGYSGPEIIIPAESIKSIIGTVGSVRVSDRQIVIKSECARFSSNLIEAKYPAWKSVMPKEFCATATVKSDDFISAIKTVQLGGDTAKFKFADGQVVIQNDKAEAVVDCSVDSDAETGFNLQYLIDAVNASGQSEAEIKVGSGARGASLIDGRFTVMPVRI